MQATPTNQTIITKSYSVQKCFLPSLLSAPDKIYQHLQFYQQLVENNIFICSESESSRWIICKLFDTFTVKWVTMINGKQNSVSSLIILKNEKKNLIKKRNKQPSNTYIYMYQINHFILTNPKKEGLIKH